MKYFMLMIMFIFVFVIQIVVLALSPIAFIFIYGMDDEVNVIFYPMTWFSNFAKSI